jgi:hypothetical protein
MTDCKTAERVSERRCLTFHNSNIAPCPDHRAMAAAKNRANPATDCAVFGTVTPSAGEVGPYHAGHPIAYSSTQGRTPRATIRWKMPSKPEKLNPPNCSFLVGGITSTFGQPTSKRATLNAVDSCKTLALAAASPAALEFAGAAPTPWLHTPQPGPIGGGAELVAPVVASIRAEDLPAPTTDFGDVLLVAVTCSEIFGPVPSTRRRCGSVDISVGERACTRMLPTVA